MRQQHLWAGLAVSGPIVVLAAWLLLSPGWAVAVLQERARATLGRELTIGGGAHLEFTPKLALRFERLSLANAEGMEGYFVTAASLRVDMNLAGLISRHMDLARITLIEPRIALTIDGIGRTSWPRETGSETASLRLNVERANVQFLDQRTDQRFKIDDATMAADISAAGELSLNGTALLNRQIARIEAYVKDLARIAAGGSPADLSLDSPTLSLNFSGRLTTRDGLGLAGTIGLSGPDLRQALRWTGSAPGGILGFKAFSLDGALDAKARAFAVRGATLAVDDVKARGDLSLDFRAAVPKLQAVLASAAINLDPYVPATGWDKDDWGKVPLGFAAMRGLDAAIALNSGDLIYSGLRTGPAKIAATLASGRLEVQIASSAISEAKLMLDGSGPTPVFAFTLKAKDLDAARVFAPLAGMTWLDGKGTLDATLSGRGQTQQELVSALQGEATIELGAGAIRGLDTPKGLAAVSREMQDGWPGDAKAATPFASLAASFTIADGIAAMQAFKLDSAALTMAGTGEVDLLRRALDLRVDPRLVTGKAGETAGLPVAIVVKGPWGAPRLYPDMADIVANPTAAYDALKAQGLPATIGGTGN
jgi:AsmA protein